MPKKILFSTVAVLGVLGLFELALRIVGVEDSVPSAPIVARTIDRDIEFPFMTPDPLLFWRLDAGFRGDFLGHPVTVNSLGIRGPELLPPASPRRTRILCFGDSITFGYGVGNEDTYACFLAGQLGTNGVEVVNCGVTGYTSFQVMRRFGQLSRQLDCDVALFCVGWNDATIRPINDLQYSRQMRFAATGRAMSRHCYIYRLFRNTMARSVFREPGPMAETYRVPPDHFRDNLRTLVLDCRANKITPVFIDLPCRKPHGPPFTLPYSLLLRQTCRELNVPLIDVGVLSSGTSWESNEAYFIDECHFNVAGHEYLGKRIADALIALGVAPARSSSLERTASASTSDNAGAPNAD